MENPLLARLSPPLSIAHRGGAALAPENTIEACRLAIERHGADMLEIDLQVTSDGELVVSHDPTLERCTDGAGPISELTVAELARVDAGYRFEAPGGGHPFRGKGVRVPTLRQLLRALPDAIVNIDLKPDDPDLAPALARLLREEDAVARACCGSKHDRVGERLRHELPDGCHFFPRQALSDFVRAALSGAELPPPCGYQVIDMPLSLGPLRLVNEALVAAAAGRGLLVNVWTVNDPGEMETLLSLGVGGIMTDRPDLLRPLVAARRGGRPARR